MTTSLQNPASLPRSAAPRLAALRCLAASARLWTYSGCTLLAVLISWWLGKDMQWDTLHYHLYAGFSALHDRFSLDYFAAGTQSYLNPYSYVPFYLLATSRLTALESATILALFQSAILWLSYELALRVARPQDRRTQVAIGVSAAVLAFANPVLIDQLGSSFADITTAELVLAGCLLLIDAIRTPAAWRIAASGVLLGAATAFKLSNALPGVSLAIVPLFLPVGWRRRLGDAALLGLCVAAGFALVAWPWSLQLERNFGNPFLPLLNGLFHSPHYTHGPGLEYRFIPPSWRAALWRPFAIATSVRMVHVESAAPDLRYVILIVVGVLSLIRGTARRWLPGRAVTGDPRLLPEDRALLALACAFLINWALWLRMSGNSRYFLPTACLAAVLVIALLFRLLARWPKLRYCVVAVVLAIQVHQVYVGTNFRPLLPWNDGPWFEVPEIPAPDSAPALYFSVGVQSNAFIVPFLPRGSGFIDLHGDYVLGPGGANGAHILSMIRRFSPHLKVLVSDRRVDAARRADVPYPVDINDALEPFGLRADTDRCARIVVPAAPKVHDVTVQRAVPNLPRADWYTLYLITCDVVPDGGTFGAIPPEERSAERALDRLEVACPAVLQPRGSVTFRVKTRDGQDDWIRSYGNTDVDAWVSQGRVYFQSALGRDQKHDLGPESAWEKTPPPIACGRTDGGLFFIRLAR
ncbi:MAG TPA: glycosyltransferase family 87 protein [Steroidobacteraceae bacterium]|nr:glycosyltransferase family 87 protein [Steroidobacteraceae bacterium]